MSKAKIEVAGAAAILEHFAEGNPVYERNAAKRVLAEVTRAWPGDARTLWWKWLSEAANSMGLRTKPMDCSVEDACSLAQDHAQFVCYRPEQPDDPTRSGHGQWLAVVATSRLQYQVLLAGEQDEVQKVPRRDLKKTLEGFAEEGRLQCVFVAAEDEAHSDRLEPSGQPLTPFARLLKLLKPEAGDVWIVVVFAFVVALLMLATPVAVEALVNTVAFGRFVQPIVVLALILLTFLGFQGAIRALQTYVVEIIQRRLFARVAGDLAYRLPRTEAEATDRECVPELVNRFFDIVTVQKVAAQLLLDGLGLVLSTFIGMAVLAFYHPWLLGFDLFLLSAIAVIIFLLGRGAIPSAVKESKHKYYMASWLEDIAHCPTAFHGAGGTEFALERADRLIDEYLNARRRHFRIVMRQVIFALALQAVASTVLLGLGGWLVVAGELTLGQLVAAELIVTVIVGSFAKFGKHMESFYDLLASVDKLGLLFDLRMERQDGMLGIGGSGPAHLEFQSVSYAYGDSTSAIENLTASVASGDRVAVLGTSGTGKSTLLDLLYGMRTPTSGHLTIDGFDPRDLRPDVLRTLVAMSRDEVFHATIEENIHLHREEVTSYDMREVLSQLGLLKAILKMPNALDTKLTCDGKPLSATQRQLLSIARAAVGRPSLLLIDGTLDGLGEAELDRALDYLTDPERPWTLVVGTAREEIAARFPQQIGMPGSLQPTAT